jgi:hypothetical protein
VCITLKCLSQKTVMNCAVFLTKLERGTVQGGNFVELPLYDAISLSPEPINLYPRVPKSLAVLKAGEKDGKLGGLTPWPFRLENAFDVNGTYRLTIEVIAEEIAKTICLEVLWTSRWDQISGRKVSIT